ncbi:MAG: carbohydrate ABC transporter permease, partial [Actinomycetota bacterium]
MNGALPLYLIVGSLVSSVFVVPLVWEVVRSFQPSLAISNPPSAQAFKHLGMENYRALLTGQ